MRSKENLLGQNQRQNLLQQGQCDRSLRKRGKNRQAVRHCKVCRADQGIRSTIKNILAHPEYQKEDKDFDIWCDKVIEALEKAKKMF